MHRIDAPSAGRQRCSTRADPGPGSQSARRTHPPDRRRTPAVPAVRQPSFRPHRDAPEPPRGAAVRWLLARPRLRKPATAGRAAVPGRATRHGRPPPLQTTTTPHPTSSQTRTAGAAAKWAMPAAPTVRRTASASSETSARIVVPLSVSGISDGGAIGVIDGAEGRGAGKYRWPLLFSVPV